MFNVYAGCILYADDILLLSGSVLKLQYMLDICYNFGYKNNLLLMQISLFSCQ